MKNSKKTKQNTGSGAESTCANSLEQNRSPRSSGCVNARGYNVTGGASCSYIQRHRLFGPGLLHLVVHDGVVDPQAAKDDESLRRDQQAGAVRGVPRRRGGARAKSKRIPQRGAGRRHQRVSHPACSALGQHLLIKSEHNKKQDIVWQQRG